jgi:hypothetical protein
MTTVPGTTPYPWPWNGELRQAGLALVVTGWDERWHTATDPGPEVLAAIGRLAAAVELVVTVGHAEARRWPAGPSLPPPELGGTHLTAAGVDGFYGSPLDHLLRHRGVDTVLLAGLGLETTVHSTMRTANDAGFECLCVVDACAPVDPTVTPNAVSMIEMSGGIFGAVGTAGSVLSALSASSAPSTRSVPSPMGDQPAAPCRTEEASP